MPEFRLSEPIVGRVRTPAHRPRGIANVDGLELKPGAESATPTAGAEHPSDPAAPGSGGGRGLRFFGPTPRWRLLDLGELWRFRELLWMLAFRDIQVRYRQAVVGVAWVVLQPLSTALVFVLLFGLLGHVPTDEAVPYGVFILPGVVLWQLFAGTFSAATGSLVGNQGLIGKVYFPRLLLPLGAAVANLVDFLVGFAVVAVVMAGYGIAPSWAVVLLPAFVLLAVAAGLACGVWGAALNALYRDTGLLVPFLLQLGFFFSPVVYSTARLIPEQWRAVHMLNPMVGVVGGFRWCLFGGPAPVAAVAVAVVVTGVTLVTGLVYFRRVEGVLADRI
jgi:lipopolysaccharide transport system permease protein